MTVAECPWCKRKVIAYLRGNDMFQLRDHAYLPKFRPLPSFRDCTGSGMPVSRKELIDGAEG